MHFPEHHRIHERLGAVADPLGLLVHLFAHAPIGMAVWRPDGTALLTNEAFVSLFGREPRPEYSVLTDGVLAANGMLAALHRAFAGESVDVPTTWLDPPLLEVPAKGAGRRLAVSMTMSPVFDDDGQVAYVATTYKDETAAVRGAEHQALLDERQRLAQQAARVGTFELNVQTGTNAWSPELEAIHGLPAGGFGSSLKSWEERVHPDDRVSAVASVNRAFDTSLPTEGEWRVVWPDGSVRWLLGRFQLLRDAAGAPHRLIGANVDITERKQSADRLRVLSDTSAEFARATDIPALLDTIARRLADVIGEACVVRLVDRNSDVGELDRSITTSYHPDPIVMKAAREHAATQPLRSGEGVPGRVIASGEGVLLPVVTTEQLRELTPPQHHAFLDKLKIASMVAVPLRTSGRAIGVIILSRSDASAPYTLDDQHLAQDLADRAAMAIEAATLLAELREANEALRRSEARFRRLTESGIIGITVSDLSGGIEEVNDAFLAIVGYSREDFAAGKVTQEVVRGDAAMMPNVAVRSQLLKDGFALPWEMDLIAKDGRRVPVLAGAASLDASSHQVIAFVLDLSKRKSAEAAVRESDARKTAVMEAALDAIVLMDHEGRIVDFNAAAESTFGCARVAALGTLLESVMIPTHLRERHRVGLERYLLTGEHTILGRRMEVQAQRKDGTAFPAEVTVVRIRSEGAPMFTGYIRDITERRQAAETEILRRQKAAIEAANAELAAFSYSVAHDLRAPLRGINGFGVILLEEHGGTLNDEARALVRRITSSAERMGQIIDSLLSLSRLSTAVLESSAIDLVPLARAVVDDLRARDGTRVVDFVTPDALVARGDPQLLQVLFENLLGNAWKFTRNREKAVIELGRAIVDGAPRYFVRDNGAGFEMKYADRLFTPFQRLHSERQFEGTGVGLATVARIIHRHGGRVWATGEEGHGAVFEFTLPDARSAEEQA